MAAVLMASAARARRRIVAAAMPAPVVANALRLETCMESLPVAFLSWRGCAAAHPLRRSLAYSSGERERVLDEALRVSGSCSADRLRNIRVDQECHRGSRLVGRIGVISLAVD